MSVWLITRLDFDNLENHEPHHSEVLGYCASVEEAWAVVGRLTTAADMYRGWDGKTYPRFSLRVCLPLP